MKKVKFLLPVLLAGLMLVTLIMAMTVGRTNRVTASTQTALQEAETGSGKAETSSQEISSRESSAASQQFDGLEVKWTGVVDTYELTAANNSVELDVSTIEVREVDDKGVVVGDPIPASDYTVELYNGAKKIELTGGKATVNEGGTYQVWVSKPSSKVSGYTCKGFARIYVMNEITNFYADETTNPALFTQEAGRIDLMSSKWTYWVIYSNGLYKQLTANDVVVSGLNTKVSGFSTATATYTSVNAKGETVVKTCGVGYTITGSYTPNMLLFNANSFDQEDLIAKTDVYTATKSDGSAASGNELGSIQVLAGADDGCNVTLTSISSSLGSSVENLSFSNRLKLNGTSYSDRRSVKLELVGAAAITVVASSNSASSPRTLALYDETFFPVDDSFTTGTIAQYTFTVSEGGTYYLGSMNSDMSIYYILVEYDI